MWKVCEKSTFAEITPNENYLYRRESGFISKKWEKEVLFRLTPQLTPQSPIALHWYKQLTQVRKER
jgi:hypothetical protein